MYDWAGFESHVSHLECSATGERYAKNVLHNLSATGKPLIVRYDLAGVARSVKRSDLAERPADLWRYRELLPVRQAADVVSLGEEVTPLVPLAETSRRLGGGNVVVKDEGRLPTGSFKARGMAVAISMAKSFGVRQMALPTVGSGGVSLAAYCARAGIEAFIFCPEDLPQLTMGEIAAYGVKFHPVKGALEHCNALVAEGCAKMGWFNMSTLKEPYRIEGKKTMGLELADQLGWELPDVIFYPTGGGTGFIGMWKAFEELETLGWIGKKRPRMVAVQATGCCPIVEAAARNDKEVRAPWQNVQTRIHGVRVAKPLGDFLILRALHESGGFGAAVGDEDAERMRLDVARDDGALLSVEGAACVAAYRSALESGRVKRDERAVVFNTAVGLRSEMPPLNRSIDVTKLVDYAAL